MDKAAQGEVATIYGDGEQYRDFVYVADVVQANLSAAYGKEVSGAIINVGTGNSVTVNSLWKKVANIAGVQGDPERENLRPGDIRESVADISRARRLIDYEPHYSLEEGLALTWKWYRERRAHGA